MYCSTNCYWDNPKCVTDTHQKSSGDEIWTIFESLYMYKYYSQIFMENVKGSCYTDIMKVGHLNRMMHWWFLHFEKKLTMMGTPQQKCRNDSSCDLEHQLQLNNNVCRLFLDKCGTLALTNTWCVSDYEPQSICEHLQYLFALLQNSNRKYIDPSGLVKALGLDTGQQQVRSQPINFATASTIRCPTKY